MHRLPCWCVAGLLSMPVSSSSDSWAVSVRGESTTHAVHTRLMNFEQAWNRGDVEAVVSQYDSSLTAILGTDYLAYDSYLRQVRTLMTAANRPQMRLEVHALRRFTRELVLANGRVHTRSHDGAEQVGLFTVIYQLRDGQWKLVYVHS